MDGSHKAHKGACSVPTQASKAPPFYDELMDVLDEVNTKNPLVTFSFRRAVVEGLGLRDSFTSKIKSGAYRPTAERIEMLANLLGVHPSRFRSYAHRLARSASVDDPRFVELFEMLAALPKEPYDIIVSGILNFTRKTLTEAASKPQ